MKRIFALALLVVAMLASPARAGAIEYDGGADCPLLYAEDGARWGCYLVTKSIRQIGDDEWQCIVRSGEGELCQIRYVDGLMYFTVGNSLGSPLARDYNANKGRMKRAALAGEAMYYIIYGEKFYGGADAISPGFYERMDGAK